MLRATSSTRNLIPLCLNETSLYDVASNIRQTLEGEPLRGGVAARGCDGDQP